MNEIIDARRCRWKEKKNMRQCKRRQYFRREGRDSRQKVRRGERCESLKDDSERVDRETAKVNRDGNTL